MSQKSYNELSMVARLMSVTYLVIDLNGSSCWSSSLSKTSAMAFLVLKTGEVERYMHMNVCRGGRITADVFKE